MAGEISDAVKKIVAILKNATSDTEKFAALFMVTKLLKGKDHNKPACKKAIFEAIGFDFLKRLLLTSDVPVDCPPSIYKSVALSILTCFCNEAELATHPEMLANIPVFLDIVQQADASDYDDNLIIVGEAYNCLKSIASFEPGQKALVDVGAISKMAEIYSQQSFQTDEALNILVVLVSKFGPESWDNKNHKAFHNIINKIALDFETDHDERKFQLCTYLNALLFNAPKNSVNKNTPCEETWPHSVYKGLCDILMSKIGKDQRNPALILASTCLNLLGVEWVLNDEEKGKQLFLLLIQLAAIEVRMQLDGKSLKQAQSQAALITACYIILELSINYIATDVLDLDQKEKQTLYTGLKGAFSAVIGLLTKVSNDKSKDNLPVEDKVFVCASVRVLVAWLAQETSAMRPQVYQLLPFILSLANETFQASKARRIAEKMGIPLEKDFGPLSQMDVLRILLPALCHLTVEDDARKIMLKVKEEETLFDCFEFHWMIVHRKRPPVPRSERLKVLNQPLPELTPEVLEEMKDSRAAMVSICNIFMNITVLEAKLVEESALFNKLLRFIFENLPELKSIPENLVLHGHLAILGLLLLKQQSKMVKKNDFSICRYIQATIRFLWDAYVVDEANDPTALVVSITYKEFWMEIMELWFLGMQTMSAVLAQIPWISEFAIESGWAEDIVNTLKKVKIGTLPPNVKSAYEDFLCHLVDANENVMEVLKKADALKMCRNHRFMELGKKLFGD
ncbi:neurochondrin homolog [Agrilus planipennis]|uniref:Neurochondrin homolog n=1 Tax=Agrilus planipennis TaxID=224129 RepID=A0A1W4XDC0_AGRPL|nr:neurochondrin homolog [Agrilus planipennis]